MILFDVFEALLGAKVCVLSKHLSDGFRFSMLIVSAQLDSGEADELGRSHVPCKRPLDAQ